MMKNILILIFLTLNLSVSVAQTILNYNGQTWSDNNPETWNGVPIPHTTKTTLTFTNNSITSTNIYGYLLDAGDEFPDQYNNNLDGAVITGNRFLWSGIDPSNIYQTHALFTGYNINVIIKYNLLINSRSGIQRKSSGMHNTSGGVAYNLLIDPLVGIVAKGMNDVRIFNNTFYSTKSQVEIWRGLIDVHKNTDNGQNVPSTGTKIFNNIFYTEKERINIYVYENECLEGFECDYNIYYCATPGKGPRFQIGPYTVYTFAEWQALGYDLHSQVINPNFVDKLKFVPTTRLDYGTDLGSEWITGLATDAVWGTTSPATADQNGTWQVGARIYASTAVPVTSVAVSGAGGSSSISTDKGTLQLSAAVLPDNATDKSVIWSITNGTGQATINTITGIVSAVANGTVTARATAHDGSGKFGTLTITISNQIVYVTGVTVTGAGGSTTIPSINGTLQLSATVLPGTATNKNVTWSIINGTGQATISATGLVTALASGTVTARATAQDGSGVYGNLVITISNQVIPVTGITVTGAGSATTITTDNGTLQLIATILPSNATNKTVRWTITNGTGQADISSTGIVTAVANGTVTARATANDGTGIYGSLVLTISNQNITVSSITVTGAGGLSSITSDNGTLQLSAAVLPSGATNKNVNWSVTNGTGLAGISSTGLLTAISNGTVTARATAVDGSGIYGTLVISISNQVVQVTSITVTGAGGASIITTDNGTLQLSASVLPSYASNKTVTWSVSNGTGQATINSAGLVTAIANGTVTARATANDGSGIYGSLVISIASQIIPVTSITVTGAGGVTTITADDGTLQLSAAVLPANATNTSVSWSVISGTGEAGISSGGLLTAINNGTVTARATANDGTGIYGSLVVTISNQIVPVSSISVTGEGGASAIFEDGGTLQLTAIVLPSDASDQGLTWSIEHGTGEATIDPTGLVTAISNGTITARASATDGSGVYGTLFMTISGQIIAVTDVNVTSEGGVSTITTVDGSLQLNAEVLPANASNKSISWSVANITGAASISADGLVTALENGTVSVQASANDGSGVYGTMAISIRSGTQKPYAVIVTTDEIKIVFFEDFTSWKADLYNLRGNHVMSKIVDADTLIFNSSQISTGLYIFVLSKGGQLQVEKIMVP